MSYTVTVPSTDEAGIEAALRGAVKNITDEHDGQRAASERDEQVAAAVAAVKALVKTVGRPGDPVVVSITGHANPAHEPAERVSDEFIAIAVHVDGNADLDPPAPAPVEEPAVGEVATE